MSDDSASLNINTNCCAAMKMDLAIVGGTVTFKPPIVGRTTPPINSLGGMAPAMR